MNNSQNGSLDSNLEQDVKEILKKIKDYNSEKIAALQQTIMDSFADQNSNQIGEVITFLARKDLYQTLNGVIPIRDERSNNYIGVFFKCSYSEFISIMDKGSVYEIEFNLGNRHETTKARFELCTELVDMEYFLRKAEETHSISNPVIYSPYSRRFAKIVFCDEKQFGNIEAAAISDISYPEELRDKICTDTTRDELYWNIKTLSATSGSRTEDGVIGEERLIAGEDRKKCMRYSLIRNKKICEYLLFDSIGRKPLGIEIRSPQNSDKNTLYVQYTDDTDINSAKKLTLCAVSDEVRGKLRDTIYQNHFNIPLVKKQRLNSQADILYVVNCFNGNPYGIKISEEISITPAEPPNCIEEYCDSLKYYSQRVRCTLNFDNDEEPIRKAFCVLGFSGNDAFIEDFARYVLEFLNEKYPEFIWKGRLE